MSDMVNGVQNNDGKCFEVGVNVTIQHRPNPTLKHCTASQTVVSIYKRQP